MDVKTCVEILVRIKNKETVSAILNKLALINPVKADQIKDGIISSIIDQFTVDRKVDEKGLASYLVKTKDPELAALVIYTLGKMEKLGGLATAKQVIANIGNRKFLGEIRKELIKMLKFYIIDQGRGPDDPAVVLTKNLIRAINTRLNRYRT